MTIDLTVPQILAALIGAGGLFGAWLLTRVYELADRWVQRRVERATYLRALFAEIDFNTRDLEEFGQSPPDYEKLRRLIDANPDYVPHITDARHTEVHRANIGRIHSVGDGLIGDVITFYGYLERIRSQVDGLLQASYTRITPESRVAAVQRIYRNAALCQARGETLLNDMMKANPKLGFKRSPARALLRPDAASSE